MIKDALYAIVVCAVLVFSGCSPGNLEYIKSHAGEKWNSVGFDVVGYEGYQWGFFGHNNYGGAKVWYRLKKES